MFNFSIATCPAQPFLRKQPSNQCLLVRTWKKQLLSKSTSDVRYRVFRALRRKSMNSTMDVATKLFDLSLKLLVSLDFLLIPMILAYVDSLPRHWMILTYPAIACSLGRSKLSAMLIQLLTLYSLLFINSVFVAFRRTPLE